jgi:hypothetical protein
MRLSRKITGALTCFALATLVAQPGFGQDRSAPGQAGKGASASRGAAAGPQSAVSSTTLTFRSHNIAAWGSQGNLEGASCPSGSKMLSGACHPFYNDRVSIINQFPNTAINAWRCGFKNNTASTVTVWIYTLCDNS